MRILILFFVNDYMEKIVGYFERKGETLKSNYFITFVCSALSMKYGDINCV